MAVRPSYSKRLFDLQYSHELSYFHHACMFPEPLLIFDDGLRFRGIHNGCSSEQGRFRGRHLQRQRGIFQRSDAEHGPELAAEKDQPRRLQNCGTTNHLF